MYGIVHDVNNDFSDDINLKLLDELTKESVITQRALADRLGVALGLVNAYLKRLYKKGYIKIKNLPRNRIGYIITPQGFSEKARLTYGYMRRSAQYFKEMRRKIEHTYSVMMSSGIKNILLWGDGEIAELCYISTRGLPLKIVGVVDGESVESGFYGGNIYSVDDIQNIEFDAILVSAIQGELVKDIDKSGVNPDRIYYL